MNVDTLNQVHQLMKKMQTAAVESDWKLLVRLDSERRQLLNTEIQNRDINDQAIVHTSSKLQVENQDHQELVDQILELDSCIFHLLSKAKESLVSKNREFSAQKNAAAGYAKTNVFT